MVPRILREHVLYQAHGARMADQLGIEKTLARIKGEYYWDDLAKDVKQYCRACQSCNERNPRGKAPMQTFTSVETF